MPKNSETPNKTDGAARGSTDSVPGQVVALGDILSAEDVLKGLNDEGLSNSNSNSESGVTDLSFLKSGFVESVLDIVHTYQDIKEKVQLGHTLSPSNTREAEVNVMSPAARAYDARNSSYAAAASYQATGGATMDASPSTHLNGSVGNPSSLLQRCQSAGISLEDGITLEVGMDELKRAMKEMEDLLTDEKRKNTILEKKLSEERAKAVGAEMERDEIKSVLLALQGQQQQDLPPIVGNDPTDPDAPSTVPSRPPPQAAAAAAAAAAAMTTNETPRLPVPPAPPPPPPEVPSHGPTPVSVRSRAPSASNRLASPTASRSTAQAGSLSRLLARKVTISKAEYDALIRTKKRLHEVQIFNEMNFRIQKANMETSGFETSYHDPDPSSLYREFGDPDDPSQKEWKRNMKEFEGTGKPEYQPPPNVAPRSSLAGEDFFPEEHTWPLCKQLIRQLYRDQLKWDKDRKKFLEEKDRMSPATLKAQKKSFFDRKREQIERFHLIRLGYFDNFPKHRLPIAYRPGEAVTSPSSNNGAAVATPASASASSRARPAAAFSQSPASSHKQPLGPPSGLQAETSPPSVPLSASFAACADSAQRKTSEDSPNSSLFP
uniref:Uncharacterized protein n=1 Tax=Chromera velia CCMP2878 TaxID=1169474 RepID=A0A0G4I8I1_9ALVE|eukprot:Cvel_11869.t1-p1 / transcript=Cvel_11869.t1 / gene=Cvel_11869 / organism=Chromera_velia_CCMP2878 / gene_product=hypothetical protein / transcript_product=hypothetical protein / location=Cvel_scaffold757:53765-55573(-) / protein_length=603 / sequence_SO=supercontig / SO=protein_coding / is_pseudo=false